MTEIAQSKPSQNAVTSVGDISSDLPDASERQSEKIAQIAVVIRTGLKRMHDDGFTVGRALLEAKHLLGHGGFLRWLNAEFGWAHRTAQRYMSIAARLEGKYDSLSHLGPDALFKLAARSTPVDVIEAVVDKVEAGTCVSAKEIASMIRQERPEKVRPDRSSMSRQAQTASSSIAPAVVGPRPEMDPTSAAAAALETVSETRVRNEATDQAFALLRAKFERDRLKRIAWLLPRCDVGELVRRLEDHVGEPGGLASRGLQGESGASKASPG